MNELKTVLHVHTTFSRDSNASPADVVATALAQRVGCIGVTDHDEIEGAFQVRKLGEKVGIKVIVGEEVSTTHGHVIGLFLEKRIPPRLSPEETVRRIRRQGGLVLLPHPYLGRHGMRNASARILGEIDAVEVCNGQSLFPRTDRRAAEFALQHGLLPYMGADAHVRGYLDACYQYMPNFSGRHDFLASLASARLIAGRFDANYFAVLGRYFAKAKVLRLNTVGFGLHVAMTRRRMMIGA